MKRFKAVFLAMVLTATFAGNIFATGSLVSVAVLPASLLTNVVNAILSVVGGDDQCPLRMCTNCRPNNEGEGDDDGNGDCRPTP